VTVASRDHEHLATFAHGVASGDPLPDRVIIWTRVTTPEPSVEARWVVATDDGLEEVVASGMTTTTRDRDLTVKIDVPGLRAGTTYWYAFELGDECSPVGRTRTAPDGDVDRLRIAFCSCAKYDDGYFNAYGRIADRDDLDVVLHLGDYFYEYGTDERSPGWGEMDRRMLPQHDCRTLDDYRTRYAQMRLDPDCQRLHATHPTVHVHDDHESADDRWREGADNHDPHVDGPFEERAAAALRAWYEWLPVRVADPDRPDRIYRRLPYGSLADVLMLDCRTWRDEQVGPPAMYDQEREMLGRHQHEWVCDQLARSTATWKLVGNPVMVGQVYTTLLPQQLAGPLAELGILTDDVGSVTASADQWDGYPAARARLFSRIRRDQVSNVVFLSGDVHTSWAVELREDPTLTVEPVEVEMVTPSVTTQNLDEKIDDEDVDIRQVEDEVRGQNPHIRWCEFDDHGYVLLDVTRDRLRAEWWAVETVLEPHEGEYRVAAFEVREGTSRLYAEAGEATGSAGDSER
jgi:alkaline phosphatase D